MSPQASLSSPGSGPGGPLGLERTTSLPAITLALHVPEPSGGAAAGPAGLGSPLRRPSASGAGGSTRALREGGLPVGTGAPSGGVAAFWAGCGDRYAPIPSPVQRDQLQSMADELLRRRRRW